MSGGREGNSGQSINSIVASSPALSVVIPALNEEDGIAGILEKILSTRDDLKASGIGHLEVIVVDDGSLGNLSCGVR